MRYPDLSDVQVFAKVVSAGSFVGAARDLSMPKSTVSRRVTALEQRLGARLLQRTTRKVSLTEVGRIYFEHARRIIEQLQEADAAVSSMQEAPRGRLRVSSPKNAEFLGTLIGTFLQRFPDVQFEIDQTDRVVDLVEDGYDLAVRIGNLKDSSLIVRSLGQLKSLLVASPNLLEQFGKPQTPADLAALPSLIFTGPGLEDRWELTDGQQVQRVQTQPRLIANDFDTLLDAAQAGVGVGLLPAHRCAGGLHSGRLVRVLEVWSSPPRAVQAVYPSTRHLSPKISAFIAHLKQGMDPPPWEPSAGLIST
jgi:DNA-binding transcriptional LysR family regulator